MEISRPERLARQLESAEWLDRWAERVQKTVSHLLDRLPNRDLLSGSPIGHPAHPLLVTAPIGCWTSALVADVIGQRDMARTFTGLGVVSVLPTAVTGVSDWVDTADAERRIGFVHLVVNLSATATYSLSWWCRHRGLKRRGQLVGLLGAGLATLGGWLGGHLVYAMGVGVDTTAFDGGPTTWTEIAPPGDSPTHRSSADGVALAVFESENGDPLVLADRCTHRGGPLSEGEVAGGCVTCPWHGSRFDLASGSVIRGPATRPQPIYEVRVSGEGTEVRRRELRSLRVNPVRPDSSR